MAQDREVLRLIWDGEIAICFQIDPDEVEGLQQPDNFYLMVKKYFSRFIANDYQDNNVWFDFNGTPLPLHYPLGVLYDILYPNEEGMPWCLTTHFSKFPEDILFRFGAKDVLESHFLSCLKEADVLKHRGQVISSMQKKDHNQLWLGLANDKFDQFWAINRRLMDPSGDQETFKYIPVRLYDEELSFTQKLISPLAKSGQKKTLHDIKDEVTSSTRKIQGFRTHGICMHNETQLQWMSEHLSYPDNFLHLIIVYENI